MTRVFELVSVTKSYADGVDTVRVVEDLSLDIVAGESLVLTGPSGSGKSTLLNILAGNLDIDAGEIWFSPNTQSDPALAPSLSQERVAWHKASETQRTSLRRYHIGYVHQFFNLIPTLTVQENILLVLQLTRRGKLNALGSDAGLEHDQARIDDLLECCGIAHRRHAFPEQLSGGEQQRTAVARALAHRPAVVLADEPTGNLDKHNAQAVAALLFDVAKQNNTALVIATHSDVVASRADRVLRLGEGESANVPRSVVD